MSSQNNPLIRLENVSIIRDNRPVLCDVNLTINRGDFMAITGPNGGGKTTLLRIILRLIRPSAGKVVYLNNGMEVKSLSIGYLPQKNMIDSRFPISVSEVVESGLLSSKGLDKVERHELTMQTIELMGLGEKAGSPIGRLSGGQLQRALLGRAIISNPELLVLDEPLSYIDKRFETRLYDIIANLSRDTTILLVSHEMSTIASMANRHFIVDGGLNECTAAHHYVRTECAE